MRAALRFAVILSVWLSASAAWAGQRVALVFSAEAYEFLRPLKNPGTDADAIKETLKALGFEVFTESNRDLKRMRRALEDFREDAEGADVALVYFAGHGVEIGGENRLLPVDADTASLERLKETSLPLEELRTAVASIAPVSILLIDACRDDPFGAGPGEGRSAKRAAPEVVAAARPGLGRMGRAENSIFAFAAAPGATALDGLGDGADGHSPFAAALVKHLGADGLEIRSALTLVQQEVYAETGGRQMPYVEGALPSLFFAAETGAPDERDALLLAMAEVTADLRADVERAATENSVPLAPLYGALISADLKALSQEDRRAKLAEAAAAFTETSGRLKTLSSTDPEVTRLREAAGEALALGATAKARGLLADAIHIDAVSGEALAGNLLTRRLSEAASHEADAGVAKTQLDHAGAIAAYERAAALHEKVEKEDVPDGARHDRTRVLGEIGDLQVLTGRTGAALAAYERMTAASEMRLANSPGSASAERDLSVSLNRIGDIKAQSGDGVGALKAYEDSHAIFQKLAAQDPANVLWQRDLSVSLEKIGNMKAQSGDGPGAMKAYEADLAIAEKLAALDPGNAGAQRDLSVSLGQIGDIKAQSGDGPGALKAFEASLAIAEKLAALDPGDVQAQRDLSVNLDRIGDMKARGGDGPGALKAFEASLAIRQKQTGLDPGNAGAQRDLSVSLDRIGDVKAQSGDGPGALKAYEASLAIRHKLAALDPGNAEAQRDLSASLSKIGDVKAKSGDGPGALKAYEADLAIAEKLAALDPGNAAAQRDLIVSHVHLSEAGGGKAHLQAALKIAEAMQAKGILAPVDAWMLDDLTGRLAKLN